METYLERFHTFEQFLMQLSETKLNELKEILRADKVYVDAVCFNSSTLDKGVSLELLLMREELYGQVISK
ncbi:hypothetical protein [Evansella clarkii]|uniref:hypothetical protein n=1 Tax=Evansella clarkii TaxID=79879 RepID=UPI000B43627E|nr:hypothetical protein [Evansella clarkii]